MTDATLLASVLAIYALSFPFEGSVRAVLSYFYAKLEMLVPFVNGLVQVVVHVALAALLLGPLGLAGVAVAHVLSTAVAFAHAYLRVTRDLQVGLRRLGRFVLKVGAAAAAGGGLAHLVSSAIPDSDALVGRVVALGVPGVAGLVVFAAALLALRLPYLTTLLHGPKSVAPRIGPIEERPERV